MKYCNSTVPGSPPQNITIVRTDPASLKVSWQPPLESYNVPFTGYVIQYVKDGSQDMIKDIKNIVGTTHTISGLVPCAKYSIKVAAMNVDKTGPFSEPVVEISGEDGKHAFAYYSLVCTYIMYYGYICRLSVCCMIYILDTWPTIYVPYSRKV